MKRIGKWFTMALAVACLLLGTSQAQTEKGRILLNTNITRLQIGTGGNYLTAGAGLQFGAGGFVADNLALGGRVSFSGGFSRVRNTLGQRVWGIGSEQSLFARYYLPIGKQVRPFVEAEAGTGFAHSESFGTVWKSAYGFAQVNAGASFFFTKNASLDLSLGVRATKALNNPTPITLANSLQAKVGMSFYLPGTKNK